MDSRGNGWLNLLLPPLCGRCLRSTASCSALCEPCLRALPRWLGPAAPPAGVDACAAGMSYAGEALSWVKRFKYARPGFSGLDPGALGVLRGVVRSAAAGVAAPRAALVVPVALHPRRLRQRGFNPATLLAREVAREVAAPLDATALIRIRDTRSQTGLGRRARRTNLRGAFRARSGARFPACVWLIDDVVTTGSTVSEAAAALRLAGATTVVVLCAARTPDPD